MKIHNFNQQLITITALLMFSLTSSAVSAKESSGSKIIPLASLDSYVKKHSSDKPLVINLSSTNKECKPCIHNNKGMEKAARNLKTSWNVATIYINPWQSIFKHKEFVKKYKIKGMPTTLIFHKNKLMAIQPGHIANATNTLKKYYKRKIKNK